MIPSRSSSGRRRRSSSTSSRRRPSSGGFESDAEGFDRDYWPRGAELGWTSLLVTDDAGGGSISGQGIVDLSLVAHEFGMHAAPGPLLPSNVVAAVLGRRDPAHPLVGALLAGDAIASWAYSEPAPDDGLGRVDLEIRVDGDDVVLERRQGVRSRPRRAAATSS